MERLNLMQGQEAAYARPHPVEDEQSEGEKVDREIDVLDLEDNANWFADHEEGGENFDLEDSEAELDRSSETDGNASEGFAEGNRSKNSSLRCISIHSEGSVLNNMYSSRP